MQYPANFNDNFLLLWYCLLLYLLSKSAQITKDCWIDSHGHQSSSVTPQKNPYNIEEIDRQNILHFEQKNNCL